MLVLALFLFCFRPVLAQTAQAHVTIILNQVRGSECCDAGNLKFFEMQLAELAHLDLRANFALRFDALLDDAYLALVAKYPDQEYGALLEITPDLARRAELNYKGSDDDWYEAQNVFLIGYNREERQKLIDTYMALFKEKLGVYPQFSSAWMIDNWSLAYLKSEYGVLAHQITREQFGTDSYTLYGGPVHYPYWPSNNWAMLPAEKNLAMPLIMRQTIMDPVFCYGDKTDSYTSQPNDYLLRQDNLNYFQHLFAQAHQQDNIYSFALIGLENSMPELAQQEYRRQLAVVKNWQKENRAENLVIAISDFELWLREAALNKITLYGGSAQKDPSEKAWWINTNRYRARLRLSAGILALSDLRLYDQGFTDPYSEASAGSLGWWITPFVIDASRNFTGNDDLMLIRNDRLKERLAIYGQPEEVVIARDLKNLTFKREGENLVFYDDEQLLLSFEPEKLVFANESLLADEYQLAEFWGFKKSAQSLEPFVLEPNLDLAREKFPQELFPELKIEELAAVNSYLYVNNRFAVAGRNPARLVFFPKNKEGESIFLANYPQINLESELDSLDLFQQHGSNGMLFIDLKNQQPKKVDLSVQLADFKQSLTVYFAPNCKTDWQYCLTHPRQSLWFLRSFVEDKLRALNEQTVKEESFVD